MNGWTVLPLRVAAGAFRFGSSVVGMIPGARYCRFLSLDSWAIGRVKYVRAAALARELLSLSDRYRDDWNYGNAVHQGHLVLGRVTLANGDVASARAELLLAGRTPGSPQLNSFGPNMRLARDLLRAGEAEVVLEYFELCRHFWQMGARELAAWTADIQNDREPQFGASLIY